VIDSYVSALMSTSHELRHSSSNSRRGFVAVLCDRCSLWSHRRPGANSFFSVSKLPVFSGVRCCSWRQRRSLSATLTLELLCGSDLKRGG
jgi:hypothetical protein